MSCRAATGTVCPGADRQKEPSLSVCAASPSLHAHLIRSNGQRPTTRFCLAKSLCEELCDTREGGADI
jgi:hypothetical protein